MNFLKFEDGYNGLVQITKLISNISTSLKGDLVPGHGARVIMILHSSAPIDLEHNVASQQTNVAIINTLSGPTICLLRTTPRSPLSSHRDGSQCSLHNHYYQKPSQLK